MGEYDFGMIGLGVMGSNLLLNMADHGYKVVGYDTNPAKTLSLETSAFGIPGVKGVNQLEALVDALIKPRKIMMLVPAGKPVDEVIKSILPLLEMGDILIDGGNSHYIDTLSRITVLKDKNIHFMGIGISGGEQGARSGPSIMPGGDQEAYMKVAPILQAIAAKVNGAPCVAFLGKNAAGHYVKMVHNGIEYAIMQLISECYDLLKHGLGLTNDELQKVFAEWNNGEMRSYLLEITAEVFKKKDDNSTNYLVDMVLDKAGAKGTGKWTSQEGLDLPSPVPSVDMAVMMRNLSTLREQRIKANKLYNLQPQPLGIDREKAIEELGSALMVASIISYAQGIAMLTRASSELKMEIPIAKVIDVWKGGCIIRSELLKGFSESLENNPNLENILLDSKISRILLEKKESLMNVIVKAVSKNYPVPCMMASLSYLYGYCRSSLPTNLIQAQRDLFGSHTFQRIDRDGIFHSEWEI